MADQKAGTVATLAIISAVGSFLLTFTANPLWGIFMALLAVVLGTAGVVIAASPKVGGGLISTISIILGILEIGIAVLGIMGVIIF